MPETDATQQEIKLAKRTTESIEKHFVLLQDPIKLARVSRIVDRLKPYMDRNLPYHAHVVDHEMINAFAIAGGNMYVTTGMLDFVKTDLELAGVIAHEMVHADRKHVIIQMARNERMTLLAIAAIIATGGHGAAILGANVLQTAVMGGYSIDIEKEADSRAIDALTKAGFNPVGMLTLHERLKYESLKHPHINPGIAQTHPETDERIAAAIKYMEGHDIPVQRKYALGVLRPSVKKEGETLLLLLDEKTVWQGKADEETNLLFERVAAGLWRFLQLETAPYDIRVQAIGEDRTFLLKSRKIAAASELPEGTETVDALRENVRAAMHLATEGHPLADYYN